MRIAGIELSDPRPVGGGFICRTYAARTGAGAPVFAKTMADPPTRFFEAEAIGLDLLRVTQGPPVPAVRAVGPDGLVLDWVEAASPSAESAGRFGRALATLHRDGGGSRFGAAQSGYVATVPLDNTEAADWPTFYAACRLGPALAQARALGVLEAGDAAAVRAVVERIAELAGPPEPPARLHGDLWSGNLIWTADDVWLVDAAAAHDGHRETDLAMLMLFGAPHLEVILSAYDEVYPRAAGWQRRLALHQVHPLLIHAIIFGGSYIGSVAEKARAALS
jgi:fructosamine-3-kinase